MNFFRQRREKRRQKPRLPGRLANCWHSVKNAVFYCILCDKAMIEEDYEDENQLSALSLSTQSLVSVSELSRISSSPEIRRKNKKIIHSHSNDKLRYVSWRTGKSPMSPSASSESGWSFGSLKSGLSLSASSSSSSISSNQEDTSITGMKLYAIDTFVSWTCSKESHKGEDLPKCPPPQNRLPVVDFTASRVQQALSFQQDLRVQYLGQDSSSSDDEISSGGCSDVEDTSSISSSLEDMSVGDDDSDNEKTDMISPLNSTSTSIKKPTTSLNMREIIGYHAGSVSMECKGFTPEPFESVPGGTIADVYKLIKRTLYLGMSKSTKTSNKQESEERYIVPTTKTAISLNRLHTEWDEQIVNVEVLLGLKKPRDSREALAVVKELGDDALSWCTSCDAASFKDAIARFPGAKLRELDGSIADSDVS